MKPQFWIISKCVFLLAPAYFSYLRWTVTVSYRWGDSSPAGPAALSPYWPWSPAPIYALRPSAKRYALSLITPLKDFTKSTELASRLTELSGQKSIRVRQWPIIGISILCIDNKTNILLFLAMFRHWWGCVWFVNCLH